MKREPYRILFLVGSLSGIVGIALWLLFYLGQGTYPRFIHASIMFFVFLWSFIAGFLLTAVPKMTMTEIASRKEILTLTCLVLIQVVIAFISPYIKLNIFIFFLQNSFLFFCLVRRFLKFRKLPFSGFVFLPFAFIYAILLPLIFVITSGWSYSLVYLLCGEAFVLNLILGLGCRLIPVIGRLPNALSPHQQVKERIWPKLLLAVIFNLGFLLQVLGYYKIGLSVRLIIVSIMSLIYFRLHIMPQSHGISAWAIKVALVFLNAYHFIVILGSEALIIAGQHILYIGVFLLLTLTIASRVMLAHGGHNLDFELKSKSLLLIVSSLIGASILRYIGGNNITGYEISTAALLSVLALGVWSMKFVTSLRQ